MISPLSNREEGGAAKSRPLAVLLVLRSLEVGGSQRQALLLARELQEAHGARVAIWTLERGEALAGELAAAGIDWECRPAIASRRGVGKMPALLALIRAIRRWRPDVILSFNDFPNRVCGAVWPWTGAKTCVWNQRDEGREVTGRFLERRSLRQVPVFAANSSQGAAFLQERLLVPAGRIQLIANGVQLAFPKRSRDQWRTALGLPQGALLVTMVANLHRFKDHETLLLAWAAIMEKATGEIHLVLAGRPGDTAATLQELCRRRHLEHSVHFIGLTDDVPGLLAASDISVFSSHLEGMPNAVLEAMAAGLPVVATRIPGSAAALGADYPLLVPASDFRALASALGAVIGDGLLRRQLGERNQARARAEFSVPRLGQRYMDLMRACLKSHHGQP